MLRRIFQKIYCYFVVGVILYGVYTFFNQPPPTQRVKKTYLLVNQTEDQEEECVNPEDLEYYQLIQLLEKYQEQPDPLYLR